ncbi:sn-glycerol-1-phosphate dehydrogenase [Propionimicrobium lymphophilum]|uniref:sn-glycerol-1-phosphate dehydrogenase n=1 Tax=Propionimicrobium lymphophilum TaxID=33012 RepID=UPI00041D2EB4|nr:sn-glycerol-1-phosphate dehydrogenase [Propionimicrobium lymphophilum]
MADLIQEALKTSTDTKAIAFGRGVIKETGRIFKELFGDAKGIIIADGNTWEVAGEQVKASLEEAGVELVEPFIFPGTPTLYAGYENVERVRDHVKDMDVRCVSIGGGTLNDLVKLANGELGRPYMNVCTAASMDGYAAFGASITRDGFKITRNCPAPAGLIGDLDIMAHAPHRLTATGVGDLIEKVPAGADWIISDILGIEAIHEQSWNLVQPPLREALSDPEGIKASDPDALHGLAQELILSGLAMQSMQSSRPASGAGHNFSHQWEMEGHGLDWEPPLSHGQKVGIGTVASCALYDALASIDIDAIDPQEVAAKQLSPEDNKKRVEDLQPIKAIRDAAVDQSMQKYVPADKLPERVQLIKDNWSRILEESKKQVMPAKEIADILKRCGAPYHPAQLDVDMEKMKLTYYQSQTIRARYNITDVLYDLGIYSDVVESLFAPGGYWAEAEVPTEGFINPAKQ